MSDVSIAANAAGRAPKPASAVTLQVNIDHVATLRQARRATHPRPVEAARLAEEAGAAGITAHLRADRRHVQDADLRELREAVRGKLNLELAATDEMLRAALAIRPHQVTLVPERPDEVTTEGGLDLVAHAVRIQAAASDLARAGIAVSLFVDPVPSQIEALARLRDVEGFEINTDAYTRPGADVQRELAAIARAARAGASAGLRVYAGHGLTTANVGPVAGIIEMEELNIGHSIVSRAVLVGMGEAVREMLAAIAAGRRQLRG
jgi:pyridoxine 5-phosphate synthase